MERKTGTMLRTEQEHGTDLEHLIPSLYRQTGLFDEVATSLDVSRATVHKWRRQLGIELSRPKTSSRE